MPPSKPRSPAGYSGTPLLKKLGIADGKRVALLGAPRDLPQELAGTKARHKLVGAAFDVMVLFATRRADLEKRFAQAAKHLEPAGGLWVAWPKKSSGVTTDLTEDRVREVALAAGLVDNKVCAIDAVWSGLRCVHRLVDRPPRK